jgi:hypothetical protein
MSFQDITVVNVDGRGGDLLGTQLALAHSARELPGATALLLSPERPARLLEGIRHVPIQRLGYFEYGLFVIYALQRFITTEFALIVQDDGWVLDGRRWRDEFRRYDYIGAPTNFARVTSHDSTRYLRGYEWVPLLGREDGQVKFVMNGGFCLRSRRLLRAPTELGLSYIIPPVASLEGSPHAMRWETDSHLEDVQLCLDMRASLENAGIRFAPFAVARHFAFEHLHPVMHEGLDLDEVFGHHSKLRKLQSLDPLTVRFQEGREFLSKVYGENRIAQAFSRLGYRIEVAPG